MQDGVVISHREMSSVPCNGESHALDSKRVTSESRFVGIDAERLPSAVVRWLWRYTHGQRYIGCTLSC